MAEPKDMNKLLTYPELAAELGKSERQIERDAANGHFPVWKDPILRRKVSTLAAVHRARDIAAEKALKEFEQRQALETRRGRR